MTRKKETTMGVTRHLNHINPRLLHQVCLPIVLTSLVFAAGSGPSKASDQPTRQSKSQAKRERAHHVYIEFDGLFFFAFPNGSVDSPTNRSECKVGIVSTRDDHVFTIELEYNDGRPSSTYVFPRSALQMLPQDIVISKIPDLTTPKGVTIQEELGQRFPTNGWGVPASRTTCPYPGPGTCECPEAVPGGDRPCAFNWIIDFEGQELHNTSLSEKRDTLRPKLHITTGLFYTRELSHPFCKLQNGRIEMFGMVAKKIGARITMKPGENLVLILDRPIVIEEIDYIDRIKLSNVRPEPNQHVRLSTEVDSQTTERGTSVHPDGDELQIFYDDLFDFPNPRDRFQFIPIKPYRRSRNEPFVCYGSGGGTWP
jgi:hypothetical protein